MTFSMRRWLTAAGCLLWLALPGCVDKPTPSLAYGTNPAVYPRGTAIAPNAPVLTGTSASSYSVAPSLPSGLVLNAGSGVISGTPTVTRATAAYLVTAVTGAGSLTCSLSLTVSDPAVLAILTQPADQSVLVGQTARFAVSAEGPGTLTYQWRQGGTPIPGATAASYITPATQLADSGSTFEVVVSASGGGSLTSASATLTVSALPPGISTLTDAMADRRSLHTATLLDSGKVLVAGGYDGSFLATAEVYDPAAYAFSATGRLDTARRAHTATRLASGKVLLAGGAGLSGALASAELYDPGTGTFTLTGSMTSARAYHTATLLPSGKVLVVGGRNASSDLASAELYDPAAGTFTATGSLVGAARNSHTATLLATGKVLVAGGFQAVNLAEAELYDPALGSFAATGSLVSPRSAQVALLLGDGSVLLLGGTASASVERYSPGTFASVGSLLTARNYFHTATLLGSGAVLVTGGIGPGSALLSATELFSPGTGLSAASGSLVAARENHTATLLADGKVLIVGGFGAGGYLDTAELYQ